MSENIDFKDSEKLVNYLLVKTIKKEIDWERTCFDWQYLVHIMNPKCINQDNNCKIYGAHVCANEVRGCRNSNRSKGCINIEFYRDYRNEYVVVLSIFDSRTSKRYNCNYRKHQEKLFELWFTVIRNNAMNCDNLLG